MIILLAIILLLSSEGCGKTGKADVTRSWTDSLGRELMIPENIERVAVTGPNTQIVMYALAPEMLAGFSSDWSQDMQQYIPEEYLKLPVLGQLYGGKEEINLEELISANVDVVIDVGEPKKTMAEDFDALSDQTGIPFVHITMTLDTALEGFKMLGDLLGIEERADEYGRYCNGIYEHAKEIMNKVDADGARKKSLFITGPDGLNVIAKDSFHAEVFDFFAENIAVVDDPSSKGTGNEADFEQMLTWNPEYIVFAPDSIYRNVSNMAEWQSIDAVRTGSYTEVPFGPYNWLGFPPSAQRYLGMLWLPSALYPEYIDYDLKTEIVQFYDMFYHCELTDEQYEALICVNGDGSV